MGRTVCDILPLLFVAFFMKYILRILLILLVGGIIYFMTLPSSDTKLYTNTTLGFSFSYPSDWEVVISSEEPTEAGVVIALVSPETKKNLAYGVIEPGYAEDLVVSYWPDINTQGAKGGDFVGGPPYDALLDYIEYPSAMKKKIGEIDLNGKTAYEVAIGGNGKSYGVMLEWNGIYEMNFPTAFDLEHLSEAQKMVRDSFQMTK